MIKFEDLCLANLDYESKVNLILIVDGVHFPDQMNVKSANVIYGSYYVVWFKDNMVSLIKEDIFA